MIRVCYRCGMEFGEKEPLEDRRVSHGLCDPCIPLAEAEIEEELRAMAQGLAAPISPLHEATR
jgi:hypothetical protein